MSTAADASATFEQLYQRAGEDLSAVPWAALRPHPLLLDWLGRHPGSGSALVVGCGLGDDAEALAEQGRSVTAFDLAPTAIRQCRKRFPRSSVDYQVADVFALPVRWREAFDLVVEARTIQSLPVEVRAQVNGCIAATVAQGGRLWVFGHGRADDEPVGSRPWPVSRPELEAFTDAGLTEYEYEGHGPTPRSSSSFTVVYGRD